MNLYIYGLETDFSHAQKELLESKFAYVNFITEANYDLVMRDNDPKVLALDPDITGWSLPNEIIARIPNLKAICLQTTGYEWVDGDYCRECSIAVTNVPHYASVSVAEKCVIYGFGIGEAIFVILA